MYNKQLDVFRRAAELKSFSQAANELYISPSAVQQQINNLEKRLGCRLFFRDNKGIRMTPEGEYLYEKSEGLICQSREIIEYLSVMQQNCEKRAICIATDWFHKGRICGEIFKEFKKKKDCTMKMVSYHHGEGDDKNSFDILEGVNCEEPYLQKFEFMEIGKIPIGIALPPQHRHAGKKILNVRDLSGETMLSLPNSRWIFDQIDDEVRKYDITPVTLPTYDQATISMCLVNNYCMHVPMIWKDFISDMVILPVEWDYEIPYGFYYRKDTSKVVKDFLRFAKMYKVQWPEWKSI